LEFAIKILRAKPSLLKVPRKISEIIAAGATVAVCEVLESNQEARS